eukprot:12915249-Prorocentrum_lima.AAC.1
MEEPRLPFVHKENVAHMPAAWHPSQVLDNYVRGWGKLGKWIGALHATKQAKMYLEGSLWRYEHCLRPLPV